MTFHAYNAFSNLQCCHKFESQLLCHLQHPLPQELQVLPPHPNCSLYLNSSSLVYAPNSTLVPIVQVSPTASPTVAATPAATTAATPAATTDPATAAGASTDSGSGNNHKGKGGLPGWAIAVIVVAALLALLALASKTPGKVSLLMLSSDVHVSEQSLPFGAICCLSHNLAEALPCQAACA